MNTNLNVSNSEYDELISKKAQKSPIAKNIFFAFVIGGLICMLGQFILNQMLNLGVDQEKAATITSISLIFIGAFLTSINLYSRIGRVAGAGSTIPITGFSNSVVAPAIEFKSEGYILGLGANMFKVAGPVLVFCITSSAILGLIYYIFNFIF